MTATGLLIFDMDGVLVDVTGSYRQAVIQTVRRFTGVEITNQEIQERKNRGGANNDWDLALEMIREQGGTPTREEVIAMFQTISYGDNCDGLISRERWLASDGLLTRLGAAWRFALFTGRMRWEAAYTLQRFAPDTVFDPIIGMEDVEREKPDPEGLLKIVSLPRPERVYYIGDTMDDCRAAQDASVPFIGIAAEALPLRDQLVERFRQANAVAVIPDINQLEQILP